jgi:O-antigen/teichoic acid export membrane protein
MLAAQTERPPLTAAEHRAAFFRQSGWLMLASVGGGALMWAVHLLSRPAGPEQYGLFVAFLSVIMCIPATPLQTAMAHQTARALAMNRPRALSGITRLVWLWTFLVWLAGAAVVAVFQKQILEHWNTRNVAGLWVTVFTALFAFWMPLFQGVLQGQQNFLWLGWSMMFNAFGRLAVAVLAALALAFVAAGRAAGVSLLDARTWPRSVSGHLATGMMAGVLLGMVGAAALAVWQTRSVWQGHAERFDRIALLREMVPLLLGSGAVLFLFSGDTMFVKAYFDDTQVGYYGSAGTLSRALLWLVGPLATVMFPRLVHSTAKAEKSNLLGLVLAGSAALSVAGALGLCVLGPTVIRIVNGPDYARGAAPWVPWYAAAVVPVAVANVLVNAMLARSSFRVVPVLVLLAAAYGFALTRFHATPVMVLQTMFAFNFVLLVVSALFTWLGHRRGADLAPAE